MKNYKLEITYDGSKYGGFQKQSGTMKTIQGEIEVHLKKLFEHKIEIIASGRTDKGVHALSQIINFKSEKTLTTFDVKNYLNENLDNDIRVLKVEIVDDRFHSRYNAKNKTYVYKILNSRENNPFKRKYYLHIPNKLNVDLMKKAATYFVGEHDFASMTSLKKTNKTTVRTINFLNIEQIGEEIEITINADGFLHNMVRIIVGTLVEVSEGTIPLNQLEKIFSSKVRSNAGKTIAPHGLYLKEVFYK